MFLVVFCSLLLRANTSFIVSSEKSDYKLRKTVINRDFPSSQQDEHLPGRLLRAGATARYDPVDAAAPAVLLSAATERAGPAATQQLAVLHRGLHVRTVLAEGPRRHR